MNLRKYIWIKWLRQSIDDLKKKKSEPKNPPTF